MKHASINALPAEERKAALAADKRQHEKGSGIGRLAHRFEKKVLRPVGDGLENVADEVERAGKEVERSAGKVAAEAKRTPGNIKKISGSILGGFKLAGTVLVVAVVGVVLLIVFAVIAAVRGAARATS